MNDLIFPPILFTNLWNAFKISSQKLCKFIPFKDKVKQFSLLSCGCEHSQDFLIDFIISTFLYLRFWERVNLSGKGIFNNFPPFFHYLSSILIRKGMRNSLIFFYNPPIEKS